VRRFTIGFGPVLARHIDAGLDPLPVAPWRLRRFEGERDVARPGSYAGKSPLACMAIIAAGPAANIGVVVALFAVVLAVFGAPGFLPIASTVLAGGPGDRAGFHVGDRKLTMDGKPIETFEDMRPGPRVAVHAYNATRPGAEGAVPLDRRFVAKDPAARGAPDCPAQFGQKPSGVARYSRQFASLPERIWKLSRAL
jgi:membrane-associated protease RseP (regulator of RpoE activity)